MALGRQKRVRMLRSVVNGDGSFEVGGVYDLTARKADSWLAYGVAEDASDAELRGGVTEEERQEPCRIVRVSELTEVV